MSLPNTNLDPSNVSILQEGLTATTTSHVLSSCYKSLTVCSALSISFSHAELSFSPLLMVSHSAMVQRKENVGSNLSKFMRAARRSQLSMDLRDTTRRDALILQGPIFPRKTKLNNELLSRCMI